MSKFNRKGASTIKTTNLAGGQAYKETPKLELVSLLLTSFVKDKFYETEKDTLARLEELIKTVKDRKFVAQAAIYARNTFGMRSISHVVASILPTYVTGQTWTKGFYDKVVHRTDDILEILAAYAQRNGHITLPKAMQKGLAKALTRQSEYQLAKYRGENKDIKLIDAVRLLHAPHNEAIAKLVRDELKPAETWETKLSKGAQEVDEETGQTIGRKSDEEVAEIKNAAWAELIRTRKLGYFALLRNLRNIMNQAPDALEDALKMLVDEKLIRKSLVLPFRYTTAYGEIEKLSGKDARQTLIAISAALDIACKNVPVFEGNTLVALDDSGSMGHAGIDDKTPFAIGSLLAAILVKANNADLLMFSDHGRYISMNPNDSVVSMRDKMNQHRTGNGTNFNAIFDAANQKYDRIVILSDMQGWMERYNMWSNSGGAPTQAFADYKRKWGANPKIYSFDLQGLGTLQFPEPNVYCIAGFSEKVFDTMKLLEQDREALIHEIEAIEL